MVLTGFLDQLSEETPENRWGVIPTPLRIGTDRKYSGDGITIAFLDSGFYAHPDLTEPENRVLKYIDITRPEDGDQQFYEPVDYSWHGTQTSTVACGNGHMSEGRYVGVAHKAKLVLIKVSSEKGIEPENISKGLRWVLENHKRYGIRVVNISLGGDEDIPYQDSEVDLAAEALVAAGVVVVVAAGNSGCSDRPNVTPPGNSPSVITVGGYDDKNSPGGSGPKTLCDTAPAMYCSSFGRTADGFLKPELIAPAIWMPAPILPKTRQYERVQALWEIYTASRSEVNAKTRKLWKQAELPEHISEQVPALIHATVERALKGLKVIHPRYQHVDGTSFAAPVVASIVAQMLEANPRLTPRQVKNILTSTAVRVPYFPVLRQGYGIVDAAMALNCALSAEPEKEYAVLASPVIDEGNLTFVYQNEQALNVHLAGDFNCWSPTATPLNRDKDGFWRVSMPALESGKYRYKYVVDGSIWCEDPGNSFREPDGHNGFNSILRICD